MHIRTIIFAFQVLVLAALPAWADGGDRYQPLRESFDPGLQEGLEEAVATLGLERAVREGRLALALVDITNIEDPRMAEINGDRMVYAASLPKIAILLGAFVQIERGEMTLDAATRGALTRMIRVSSNQDATRMLRRVGKGKVIDILRDERFRLYDPQVGGGLWVGKEYSPQPAYRRDPLNNLSHGATALQTARFYYLLESGQLVGPRLTAEMKTMLGRPKIKHKFVRGLARFPQAKIYRKSGSWRQWHADSAIVEQGRHRYIAVALAEDPKGGIWLTRLIGRLHRLVVKGEVAARPE